MSALSRGTVGAGLVLSSALLFSPTSARAGGCGEDVTDLGQCQGGTVQVGATSAAGLHIFETDTELVQVSDLAALDPDNSGPVTGYRVTDNCIEVALDAAGCHTRECTTKAGQAGVSVHLLYNLAGQLPPTDPGWQVVQPTPCQPFDATSITLADLDADVARALEGDIPVPASAVSTSPPGGTTLTGLPTLFRAEPPPGATTDGRTVAWTFSYTAAGGRIPVTITGLPSFSWDFGDGADLTTLAPGTLFHGQDPRDDLSAYPVQHTYSKASDGPLTVTETTTWGFSYTTPAGTRRTVPGTVVRTSTVSLTVGSVRARLVEPDHPG